MEKRPTGKQIDAMIEGFQLQHRMEDVGKSPHLTREEMASLVTLLSLRVPGASKVFGVLMVIDPDAVTGDIIQTIYGLGYMRALEDLRQERVVI